MRDHAAVVLLVLSICTVVDGNSCDVARLPFAGMCPPSELVCPACPLEAPVKCPTGGCVADVRTCPPNVWLRGTCNATTCDGVQWCHVLQHYSYVCWERAPSTHNATLTFTDMGHVACGVCTDVYTRYPCQDCCGGQAVGSWSSSYATDTPRLRGGGVFMEGGWWVCMLKEVAEVFGIANAAAGLEGRDPWLSAQALGDSPHTATIDTATSTHEYASQENQPVTEYDASNFPMPDEYSLT